MRLTTCSLTNFCSYKELEFDFSNLGLTLISGPTGSGKSTLMDGPAWTLFGRTSKDGAADDVKAWGETSPTIGVQTVETPQGTITVTRIRGRSNQNDLFWTENTQPETKVRGKDATETQKLLEARLGTSCDLFFTAAYFHQFSRASDFFTAKPKERRDLLETIADLSLAVKLGSASSESRKRVNEQLKSASTERDRLSGRLSAIADECERAEKRRIEWDENHRVALSRLGGLAAAFAAQKADSVAKAREALEALPDRTEALQTLREERREIDGLRAPLQEAQKNLAKIEADLRVISAEYKRFSAPGVEECPTCLGDYNNPNKHKHLEALKGQLDDLTHNRAPAEQAVKALQARISSLTALNTRYEELLAAQRGREQALAALDKAESAANTAAAELQTLKATVNPHTNAAAKCLEDLEATNASLLSAEKEVAALEKKVSYLTQVYDLSMDLRGLLLENTVRELEGKTNESLETYFDGELKVSLTLDGDKLEATLQKSGYDCGFKQLSGGQRCMLKLAFGTALMEASANKAGVHFSTLFFDESLNGLDDSLKVKAFSLFQKLETTHESVLLIEHSEEFKSSFSNRFDVTLEADASTIRHLSNG